MNIVLYAFSSLNYTSSAYADDAFSYARTHRKPTPKYTYLVDVEIARYWYKEAAKNGNSEANFLYRNTLELLICQYPNKVV